MKADLPRKQRSALREALDQLRGGLGAIAALSVAINVLTLAGSIYMMMVYDRILPSQSLPTLFSLFLMTGVAFAFLGAFDMLRSRMLADVGAALDRSLVRRVQAAEMRVALEQPGSIEQVNPMRDLDQIRSFIASPGPPALIDLPWILFFLMVLTIIHYWLGVVTLVGAIVLAGLTAVAERVNRQHVTTLGEATSRRRAIGARQARHAEVIAAMGMGGRIRAQWERAHLALLDQQSRLTDAATTLSGLSRIFRMFLQSAVLSVGAILVIDGKATVGVIFASSILSARALAPVDQAISNWRGFVAVRQAWARLAQSIELVPAVAIERTQLPPPCAALEVDRLALVPPGGDRAVVAEVKFKVSAGQALGVIGPSASGKSSLMRGVVGAWKPARGTIRLDGATLGQWDRDELGPHIGYLPQTVELFPGTVAANIARFEIDAPSDRVIAAAEAAGLHESILLLPHGYETEVGEDGGNLSAGQRQRIALARALYRDPFLVVLDEPNSNLDPEGEAALARAIEGVKARRGIVVLVAHRAAVLDKVDLLLVMRGGAVQLFGPRDDVLAKLNPTSPRDGSKIAVLPKRG